jgi:excisionase family DNA binding protein
MPLQRRFKKPPASVPSPETAVSGPRLLNLKKSAEYLSAHPWALRQLVRSGQIPHIVGIGRGYKIDRADLDRYIAKNKIGVSA